MDDPIGTPGVDVATGVLRPQVSDLPAFGGLRWNDDAQVMEVRRLTYATEEQRAMLTTVVNRLIAEAGLPVEVRLVEASSSDPVGDAQTKTLMRDRASWAGEQAIHLNLAFYDHRIETVVVLVAPEFDQAAVVPPVGAFPVEFRVGGVRLY